MKNIGDLLIKNTPGKWVEWIDIKNYAQRQAQSCVYLEKMFGKIKQPVCAPIFKYLINVHRRQYQDLSDVVFIPRDANRKSFYFDNMYKAFNLSTDKLEIKGEGDLIVIFAIQMISYLRGKDRYKLLKEFGAKENAPFVHVWKKFYQDAGGNAEKTFEFMRDSFDKLLTQETIQKAIIAEDKLMRDIWQHDLELKYIKEVIL